MTMIHQLLEMAKGKIDQVILNTYDVKFFAKDLSSAKIPALIINNSLPIDDTVDMKDKQDAISQYEDYLQNVSQTVRQEPLH